MSATLKLTRKSLGVQRSSFQIVVDGKTIGSIGYKQTVNVPVAPGRHSLRVISGRQASPVRSFSVADGGVASFWCRGSLAPLLALALQQN